MNAVRVHSVLAVLALLLALGCSQESTEATRPVTRAEAATLAGMLRQNLDVGGAHFAGTVPYGRTPIEVKGTIDWANHVGRLELQTPGATAPRAIVWNPNVVFEEVPGLADRLRAAGRSPKDWVARPLNPQATPLHLVLRLLNSLASTQTDNPVLVAQNTKWLRRESVNGTPTDVFRSDRTTYWISRADKQLHKLQAELAATNSTVDFTFSKFGPLVVDTPPDPSIVALEEVSDVYRDLTTVSGSTTTTR